jgi:hypothetical protein
MMLLGLCATDLLFRQFRLPVVLTMIFGAFLRFLPVVRPTLSSRSTGDVLTNIGRDFPDERCDNQADPWLAWVGPASATCMQPRWRRFRCVADPAPRRFTLHLITTGADRDHRRCGVVLFRWRSSGQRIAGGAEYMNNDRRALYLLLCSSMYRLQRRAVHGSKAGGFLLVGWDWRSSFPAGEAHDTAL